FVTDNRARNYNASGRRPHTLTVNYGYDIPELSKHWDNGVVKAVFDNWQVSGVTSVISGAYGNFSYTFTNVPSGALSGTGSINRRRRPRGHRPDPPRPEGPGAH